MTIGGVWVVGTRHPAISLASGRSGSFQRLNGVEPHERLGLRIERARAALPLADRRPYLYEKSQSRAGRPPWPSQPRDGIFPGLRRNGGAALRQGRDRPSLFRRALRRGSADHVARARAVAGELGGEAGGGGVEKSGARPEPVRSLHRDERERAPHGQAGGEAEGLVQALRHWAAGKSCDRHP